MNHRGDPEIERGAKPLMSPSAPYRAGRSRYAALTAMAGLMAAATPVTAVTIELKDVASDRVERQRAAAEGNLPLAGTPDLARLKERLAEKGVKLGAPILLRAFKSESEFEVWIRKDDGTYVLFATYPVCHWSGTLGPKLREGDKQTPEGFYTVTRPQMHHVGRWPRSLNLGFPNVFDQVQSRNGSHILVHGGCSSVGCFAMTNAVIEEIYGFTERAIAGGQTHVPVHVFPFRLTEANLAQQKDSPWHSFWANLKEGYDFVETTKRAPRISVCDTRYRFRDPAPEEGAETGPLAPCGATLAALEALERLSPAALALRSLQLNPAVPSPRSLAADLHRYKNRPNSSAAKHATPAPGGLPSLVALPEHRMGRTLRPPCSMVRASCRHFMANQERAMDRRASSRKRQQQAAR